MELAHQSTNEKLDTLLEHTTEINANVMGLTLAASNTAQTVEAHKIKFHDQERTLQDLRDTSRDNRAARKAAYVIGSALIVAIVGAIVASYT